MFTAAYCFMMGRLKPQLTLAHSNVGLSYPHCILRHLWLGSMRLHLLAVCICIFALFGRSYTNLLRRTTNSNNMTCTYPTVIFNWRRHTATGSCVVQSCTEYA